MIFNGNFEEAENFFGWAQISDFLKSKNFLGGHNQNGGTKRQNTVLIFIQIKQEKL